jgi:hypothetical protein
MIDLIENIYKFKNKIIKIYMRYTVYMIYGYIKFALFFFFLQATLHNKMSLNVCLKLTLHNAYKNGLIVLFM